MVHIDFACGASGYFRKPEVPPFFGLCILLVLYPAALALIATEQFWLLNIIHGEGSHPGKWWREMVHAATAAGACFIRALSFFWGGGKWTLRRLSGSGT